MGWILVILGVLAVAGAISSFAGSAEKIEVAQKSASFEAAASSRALAYADYLRRTSDHATVKAMTDNELRDRIIQTIRWYKSQGERADNSGFAVCAAGVLASAVAGFMQASWTIGIVGTVVSFAVGLLVKKHLEGQRDAMVTARQFEVERLKI